MTSVSNTSLGSNVSATSHPNVAVSGSSALAQSTTSVAIVSQQAPSRPPSFPTSPSSASVSNLSAIPLLSLVSGTNPIIASTPFI